MTRAINTAVTIAGSDRATRLAYPTVMRSRGFQRLVLGLAGCAASAAGAAPPAQMSLAQLATPNTTRQLLVIDEGTKDDVPYIRLQTSADHPVAVTAKLQLDQGVVVPSLTPVNLQLEPLAGHLSLASTFDISGRTGFTTSIANNVLGVGLTQAYGVTVGGRVTVSPFAALDYNRVDSTRLINLNSPRPFTNDNADTGLTAAFGVAVQPSEEPDNALKPSLFAAAVLGSDNVQFVAREASTVGARIVQSIGSNGPEVLWTEFGAGVSYTVSAQSELRASLIQSVARPNGDGIAAQLVWRARW